MSEFLRKKFCFFYIPLSLVYMELVFKLWCFRTTSLRSFVYTTLLSGAFGFALSLSCCIRQRFSRNMPWIWLLLAYLLFGTQAVYFRIFKTFVALFSLTKAGGVFGSFLGQALLGILNTSPCLLALALPIVLWFVFRKKLVPEEEVGSVPRAWMAALFLVLHLAAVCSIMGGSYEVMSPAYLYSRTLIPNLSEDYFGVLTTLRLDLRDLMLTHTDPDQLTLPPDIFAQPTVESSRVSSRARSQIPSSAVASAGTKDALLTPQELAVQSDKNVLEIDFDALLAQETDPELAQLHAYFRDREPTAKNEYTGMFAGKNLIWIVAESFSSLALDPIHTPTLCRLSQEGFVFNNFYNPLWGVSTSDGEYVTLCSLLPKYGIWSFSASSENYMPFSLGNQLAAQDYLTRGYHDHTFNYYDRDKSHPNIGYDWIGRGNGLELQDQFPESDVEMIEKTVGDFAADSPFHVYYLTVSGHMFYDFYSNAIAMMHHDDVLDLDMSDTSRAYIACSMELDAAVSLLLEELEAAGTLDDTVIVLSGDHYPYALDTPELEELHGGAYADDLEMYRSTLIVWSPDMDAPIPVDKYCSSLDVLPTLSNLFGVPYDSRLLMGRDILSDSEPLIVFSNHSFISDRGRFIAVSDTFLPAEDADWSDTDPTEYARRMHDEIDRMFSCSSAMLLRDYYAAVFKAPPEE